MSPISRREFLAASAALGAFPLVRGAEPGGGGFDPPFVHGVASGDPLADRVILWTRVSPIGPRDPALVAWEMARDPGFTRTLARGEVQTGAARDFTVKVDVPGLAPGNTYYYRFTIAGSRSPVGRTRTLPEAGVSRVRLGVVSCSNLPYGYFNAYACLARRAELDAVLHLGDYLYESRGRRDASERVPVPARETVTLADYRERHAQYKSDPDAQEVHRQHPFIVVWDDHEISDNAWTGGALGHDPKREGSWRARRAAALQAYFEWMPIRENRDTRERRIYRTFRFGALAELIMLDTRIVGRDQQVGSEISALDTPTRTILGGPQEQWLAGKLEDSVRAGTPWQVIGQQVKFAPQVLAGEPSPNSDTWDGYRGCRERVFDMVERARVENLAVLTGDMHSSWVYDLPRRPFDEYDSATGRGSLGIELVGTSVTSPNRLGRGPNGEQELAALRDARPHLHYVDGRYRGYFVVDVTRERLQADYYAMGTIEERSTDEEFVKGFVTEEGGNHLVEVASPAAPTAAPEPAP
jgi:alkaline phosphatase D